MCHKVSKLPHKEDRLAVLYHFFDEYGKNITHNTFLARWSSGLVSTFKRECMYSGYGYGLCVSVCVCISVVDLSAIAIALQFIMELYILICTYVFLSYLIVDM